MHNIFVAGIDTNAGKTIVSAILTEALGADYWKPIQAGNLSDSDTHLVKSLVAHPEGKFHAPAYSLLRPMSPHIAAQKEGIDISLDKIVLPETSRPMVVEGAGGVMTPINNKHFIVDLIKHLNLPVVLVSRNYLGSINHTLLTAHILRHHHIEVKGIIFNGDEMEGTEEIIIAHTGYTVLGRIAEEEYFDPNIISRYAQLLAPTLNSN